MTLITNQRGYQETKIVLQTRSGVDIDNYQSSDYSPSELAYFEFLKGKYFGAGIKYRTNPIPVYNCHGMTFASRRTCITDPALIYLILEEDKYSEVNKSDVLPGDIILYFEPDKGEIVHSGVVVSEPDINTGALWIVSKWGRFSEVYHWSHVGPYSEYTSSAKYFRIRK